MISVFHLGSQLHTGQPRLLLPLSVMVIKERSLYLQCLPQVTHCCVGGLGMVSVSLLTQISGSLHLWCHSVGDDKAMKSGRGWPVVLVKKDGVGVLAAEFAHASYAMTQF